MKVDQRFLWGFVLLLLFPALVQANAGTPLMIAEAIHLVIGNSLIGILEGLILSLAFGAKWWKSILVMIVGNYFTGWLGMAVLKHSDGSPFLTIDNFVSRFFILVFIAYLMTLVFEFPFVYFALKSGGYRFLKAAWGSLVVQTVSYFLLLAWYGAVSHCSLVVDASVVPLSEIHITTPVLVSFISVKEDVVFQGILGKGEWEKIGELKPSQVFEKRLIVRKSLDRKGQVDLFCSNGFYDGLDSGEMVVENFTTIEKSAWNDLRKDHQDRLILEIQNQMSTIWNTGLVPRLGDGAGYEWEMVVGDWNRRRITGTNKTNGTTVKFAMTTPIVNWSCTNATQIPGDLVLFQLGENQICLYDPNTKRIALVAKGNGPVAVLR